MSRKPQENPALDMTPMIDVVFELIIFFVVTLAESQKKDESIELEDGRNGAILTPDELPPRHMEIEIARNGRISMGDVTLTPDDIHQRVKEKKKLWDEFPILIRADFATEHVAVRRVMDACTTAGIWRLSFVAVQEDKTSKPGNPARKRLAALKKRGN